MAWVRSIPFPVMGSQRAIVGYIKAFLEQCLRATGVGCGVVFGVGGGGCDRINVFAVKG